MRPVLAGVVAAALVALGGCGLDIAQDDDVDPTDATVRAGLADLYGGADGGCFADALLDRLSLDDLVRADVVRDDGTVTDAAPMLDVDVAGAWVDASLSCTPYDACVGDALGPERLREALVATLSGGYSSDPAAAELASAEARCAETP